MATKKTAKASKKTPASAKSKAAKKTTAKARATAPAKVAKKASKADALDPSREWSLDEVERHLPRVDATEMERVLASLTTAQTDDQLVQLGTSFRTEDILAAAPNFTVGVLLALRRLGSPPPGLAPALVPLFVQQARELGRVNAAFEQQTRDVASTISGRRERLKLANGRALRARRNVATTLLRNVVPAGSPKRAELEKAAARAATPAATVASARAVARILEELRADERLVRTIDDYGFGDAYVERLRGLADEVERLADMGAALTPPQSTSQRVLDRQDGLVLAIMRAIFIPLRHARAEGARIELPPVGAVERMFERSSGGADPTDDDDAEDDAPPPAGS